MAGECGPVPPAGRAGPGPGPAGPARVGHRVRPTGPDPVGPRPPGAGRPGPWPAGSAPAGPGSAAHALGRGPGQPGAGPAGAARGASRAGTRRSRTGPVLAAAVVAGYAAVAGGYPSFSAAATVAVLAPGVALLGYAVTAGPRHPQLPARRVTRRGALLWAIPVLTFSALEVVNDKLGSTWEHPTLSVLMDPLLAHHGGRSAAMAIWLAVGIAVARL